MFYLKDSIFTSGWVNWFEKCEIVNILLDFGMV